MWKILVISIIVLKLCSCSLFGSGHRQQPRPVTEFDQARYYVSLGNFNQAEPLLLKTVSREDENYAEATLLLAKVYDQTALPEKSILNLRDFISRAPDQLELLKAQALLLKNLAKVNINIENAEEKKAISRLITSKSYPTEKALENLRWSMDFNCGIYCLQEIDYLKEIQLQILYVIETDPQLFKRSFDILTSRYDYFESFLNEAKLDIDFRKKIALNLFDALQKLKSSHLENSTLGSVKTAELVSFLETYQKRIELWLYE